MKTEDIHQFFGQFEHAQTEHQIDAVDIWNMNEYGFQIDVRCGQWVITPVVEEVSHQFTHLIDSIEDTEYITVIETISARAVIIDFFIIIKRTVI